MTNDFSIDFSHHAYLLEGDTEKISELLKEYLHDKEGIQIHGNPDFFELTKDTLTIDDARNIAQAQMRKTLKGNRQIFLIGVNEITREAQNALLKVFEEPTSDTFFFLILPHKDILLTTLRSRTQIISVPKDSNEKESQKEINPQTFIDSSIAKRLQMIKRLIDEKNKKDVSQFVDSLEKHLYKLLSQNSHNVPVIQSLQKIQYIKGYSDNKGASIKLILEYISVSICLVHSSSHQ